MSTISRRCRRLLITEARTAPVSAGAASWRCRELAKLKVRKEHYVLAELHRLLPQLDTAEMVVWDCRIPGGCSLRRPDHLFAWPERYIHTEVNENGHAEEKCEDEDSRLELIAADLGRPGLVVRIDPDFTG